MTKEKDKWIHDLRNRMEDYSEPLPDNMWERIERDLPAPKAIPLWRTRAFAAAAAVTLILISSLTVWLLRMPEAESLMQGNNLAATMGTGGGETLTDTVTVAAVSSEILAAETGQVRSRGRISAAVVPEDTIPSLEDNEEPLMLMSASADTVEPISESSEEKPVVRSRSISERSRADRRKMEENSRMLDGKSKNKDHASWSVGLSAGNTPYTSSSSFEGRGSMDSRAMVSRNALMSAPSLSSDVQAATYSMEQNIETDIHHKIPVTVGASFKWSLDKSWALETGIYYTFLSSDRYVGTDSYRIKEEQKLHYVGVPLKVHRMLWENRRLSVYTSAGVMIEKCVKGTQYVTYADEALRTLMQSGVQFSTATGIPPNISLGNEPANNAVFQVDESTYVTNSCLNVDSHPWQFSALWAAGVQVNVTKHFGLYAEPGIAYYFDDGSDLRTIRKDHPFNFNLQIGLRYSFVK